ncbi:MAG: hypothetical protein QOG84_589 [Sphingomonadales bacterium]|jgi:hypothetical protein|nr:hypothetical protein [Sphingomonadales bacterium]
MKIAAIMICMAASVALAVAGTAAEAKATAPKLVTKVNSASVMVVKSPHGLRICAVGTVPTGGWTKPTLTPLVYVHAPTDGIYDFDFDATPPSGIVIQRLSLVRALKVWPNAPKSVKGVRIHGAKNAVVAMLGPLPTTCLRGAR